MTNNNMNLGGMASNEANANANRNGRRSRDWGTYHPEHVTDAMVEEAIIQMRPFIQHNAFYRAGRLGSGLGLLTAEDLEQEAAIGIVEAAQSYDPTRGMTWRTYAWQCAQWAMSQAIHRAMSGRDLLDRRRVDSLNAPITGADAGAWERGDTLMDTVADDTPTPEDLVCLTLSAVVPSEVLHAAVHKLSDIQQEIIWRRIDGAALTGPEGMHDVVERGYDPQLQWRMALAKLRRTLKAWGYEIGERGEYSARP